MYEKHDAEYDSYIEKGWEVMLVGNAVFAIRKWLL